MLIFKPFLTTHLQKMETLSDDEIKNLKEVFVLIAKDDNVGMRTKDLRLALKSLGYNPTEAECQDLINLINGDDPNDKMILYFSKLLSLMSTESDDKDEDQALKEASRFSIKTNLVA